MSVGSAIRSHRVTLRPILHQLTCLTNIRSEPIPVASRVVPRWVLDADRRRGKDGGTVVGSDWQEAASLRVAYQERWRSYGGGIFT